jgi:hypothetical protein
MTRIEDPRRLELIAEPVAQGRVIGRDAAERAAAEVRRQDRNRGPRWPVRDDSRTRQEFLALTTGSAS